ncbi:MAG: tetratricopeptide repeat protein [Proteobacteria bacterium]|nr:tetratricopeptide repeat protein [Pseudomonadota bacterium]
MTAKSQGPRPGNPSPGPELGTLAYDFDVAFGHHRAGRLDQAERRYRRILRRDPGNPEALNMMGVAAGQRGKPGEAIDLLRQAVEAEGLNPVYHYNLAMACQAANDLDGAKAGYRRALELEPDHADALKGLGGVHLLGGELGEAEACCRQALDLAPDDALAHYNLSTVLLARIDLEGAAASAREALRLAPDLAGGHANLGTAQLGLEAYDDASACFREALRLDPRNAEAHNNLALALIARGRIEEALASIRQALAVRPGYVEAHCNLGNACRELGRCDVAVLVGIERAQPGLGSRLFG